MIMVADAPVRVLLVDDDADDALLTQRLLHSAMLGNYVVDWRDGFDSGLAALAETDYDVMLLDFKLTGEDGLELLRVARSQGTRSPAILLTGQIDRDLDAKAMEAGVVDFLEKGQLNAATLERSIRYAAGRGRSDRERVTLLESERAAKAEAETAHTHITTILETLESERTTLRQSEAFFRAAFLGSAVPAMLVSMDGAVIQANPALCEMLGYDETELTGLRVSEFTHPDHSAAGDLGRARLVSNDADAVQVEKQYVRRDGSPVDVRVSMALVRLRDDPGYFMTQVFDITEQKRAQLAIAEREQHLAMIVSVQQEIATAALDDSLDDSKVLGLIAQRAAALTGADGAGVAMIQDGRVVYKVWMGDEFPAPGRGLALETSLSGRCAIERRPLRCDDVLLDPRVNGSFAGHVNARALICAPLLIDDTSVGVLTVYSSSPNAFQDRDVHTLQLMAGLAAAGLNHAAAFAARQALVVERTLALETLSEREALIRSLIENAADPLITLDESCQISYASPALERLLGLPATHFQGSHPSAFCHPADRELVVSTFADMIATKERTNGVEARFEHRDGSWRTVRITGRNMLDDPAARAVIVNLHDTTDEVVAASQIRQAQKLEAVGQLAGGVAHDFNNLLTVILGHSEFLLQSLEEADPRYDDVVEIRHASDRAAGLTRQLLAFSRQQMLKPMVVDMNAIVAGMRPLLERLIGEDIEFVISGTDGCAPVLADPGQLEQVVMNLAINGRDAMPAGGTLSIEVNVVTLDNSYPIGADGVKPGQYVLLAITDTGMGMSQEVREQIFDPFFTTKESGKGTGLGLSTVYGIVKQSGGYVWAYSEPGLWSAFKVYLPLASEGIETAALVEAPAATAGSETVLLVEDEAPVREVSRRILVGQGYQVLEACDGIDALDVVARFDGRIDVLVTDVVMPRMNGRALADQLSERYPHLAVLFLSGYTSDEILRRSPAESGSRLRLLQKPFTRAELAAAVRDSIIAAAGQALDLN